MPFPVVPILAGVGALSSLFGNHDRETVPTPQFFGNDMKKIEALLKERNDSAQAGAIDSIREELSNAGLLQSGNLPDAITRLRSGLAGQNYGDVANLYTSELGRARDFQSQKYFADLGFSNDQYLAGKDNRQRSFQAFGGALGQYFAEKEADKRYNRLLDYFESTHGGGGGGGSSLPALR